MNRAMVQAYSATGSAWQRGPGRVYDRLADAVVAASPVPLTGRTVLDLGAGTGAATRAIGAAGGTSIAADLAVGMLRAIDPPVPSTVADARALPFADRSLDGVVAAFALNHLPDPQPAMREAARVSRPGSPVLISAYAGDDTHPVKDAVTTAATELGWQPEAWIDELRATVMPILASVDGALEVALDAGLPHAQARRLEVAFPELGPEELVAWRCGMAQLAPFVALLTPAQQDQLRARAIELLGEPQPLVRRVVLVTALV